MIFSQTELSDLDAACCLAAAMIQDDIDKAMKDGTSLRVIREMEEQKRRFLTLGNRIGRRERP